MTALKWTEDLIRAEARKYESKAAFQRACSGAYTAARRRGIVESLGFIDKLVAWDEQAVRDEAAKYLSKADFKRGSGAAYEYARTRGFLNTVVFEKRRFVWTVELISIKAREFKTKAEFKREAGGAYAAACHLGVSDDLGLVDGLPTDNDAIYIWRAVGEYFNGNPVYKIGVTSQRLGTRRIEQVARDVGFEFELICCEAVQGKATDLEKKLHILGENPGYSGFDGATEFRALSDSALYAAVSLICNQL